jgi:hypothetical protein
MSLPEAESDQNLKDHIRNEEAIAQLRAKFARITANTPPEVPLSEEEIERRNQVLDELVTETERLGLYK